MRPKVWPPEIPPSDDDDVDPSGPTQVGDGAASVAAPSPDGADGAPY
jgi:hypothetical protein